MNQLELECTLLQIDDMKYIKKKMRISNIFD